MWRWLQQFWNWLGPLRGGNRVDIDSFAGGWEGLSHKIIAEKESVAESLALAVDAAQMGQWDLDLIHDRTRRTLRHDQIFGYASLQPEWRWQTLMQHIVPEDRGLVTEQFFKATQTGGTFDIECRIIRPDCSTRWIATRGRAYLNDQGVPIRIAGVVMDVTERMWAEERFRATVESAPTAMVMINADGKIMLVNHQTERLFGYARKELLGQTVEMLVPERFRADHPQLRVRYFSEPLKRRMGAGHDLFGLHKSGREFPVEIGLNPINTTEGLFVLAGIIDISERFRAAERLSRDQRLAALNLAQDAEEAKNRAERNEEALANANRELQNEIAQRQRTAQELVRSNQELEQFAYIASHDLQEPLRKVQSFGDLLASKAGPVLGEEERDYLKRMQAAANRMQVLVNDLLAFARVTSQAKPFSLVDMNKIAREVLSDLEVRVKSSGGRVIVESLPNLDSDPLQMRQLLQNLIGNALKFHRPNVPPVIAVDSRMLENNDAQALVHSPSRQVCEFTIRDNGIGFDEKYLDRIFLPFQRLHGRSEYEGTGMGLAICRKIVERHGGTITARSTPGEGTTFVVVLPLKQSKAEGTAG